MSDKAHRQSERTVHCRYYIRGFCLHGEGASPGYDDSLLCMHMADLVKDWDAFLDRAEAFGLEEKTAAAIWNRMAAKKLSAPASCSRQKTFAPHDANMQTFVDCPHIAEGVCLLALPHCMGVCSFFARRQGEAPV